MPKVAEKKKKEPKAEKEARFDNLLKEGKVENQAKKMERKEFKELKGYSIKKALMKKKYKFDKASKRFV